MKVISFSFGLTSGYNDAFNELDKRVAALNAANIRSVTDTLYPALGGGHGAVAPSVDTRIVRVVVYDVDSEN